MKNKGQNLVEFGMILGAVVVVCIIALTFFGDNVKALFTGSSSEYNKQNAFKWKEGTASPLNQPKQYTSNVPANFNPNVVVATPSTSTVSGIELKSLANGSISFTVGDQEVILTSQMQDLTNVAFETSGATGNELLVKEIAYMIRQHSSEYTDKVPVEVTYGDMNRTNTVDNYNGTASINSLSVKVGNHFVALAKDQQCTGTCSYAGGTLRFEGTYDSSGNTTGTIAPIDNLNKTVDIAGNFRTSPDGNLDFQSKEFNLSKTVSPDVTTTDTMTLNFPINNLFKI